MEQAPSPRPAKQIETRREAILTRPAQSRRWNSVQPPDGTHQDDVPAQYWATLWRSRWIITGLGLFGVAVGVLVAMLQTPIYRARTSIELQIVNQDFLNMGGTEPTAVNYSAESYMVTQMEVLESDALAQRALARITREGAPAVFRTPPPSKTWFDQLRLVRPKSEDRDKAYKYLLDNLTVKGSGLTRIVQIVCESPHPALAADFVNALTAAYVDRQLDAKRASTQRSSEFLNTKLKELKTKLESDEQALQSYSIKYGLLFTADKENIEEESLRRLEVEMSAAQDDRMQKRSRYEQAVSAPPESLPAVMDSPDMREYQSKLIELRRQLAEASASYKHEHPKVQRLQAQIAELRSSLVHDRDNILRGIANDFETAARRERMLEAAIARQRKVVNDQAARSTRYNLLKREVDTTRQLYEAVLQKIKETGVAGAMPVSNVQVVDRALIPDRPTLPSLPLNCALGFLGGVCLGLVCGGVRNRVSPWVRVPGEIKALLGTTELGSVPSAKVDWRANLPSSRPRQLDAAGRPVGGRPKANRHELAVLTRNTSVVAEAYRAVLTSILFAAEEGRVRTIVVTSPSPREGKTSSVCNLAIALGELGMRVLVVDGDVRKPAVHEVFEIPKDPGLSDYLRSAGRHVLPLPVATDVPGVKVIPAGAGGEDATNKLYSNKITELINAARREFDIVLFDTPPMLAVRDARMLARLADGVVLVIRAGRTSKAAAAAAMSTFRDDGTPVLGAILNDWNPASSGTRYGEEYLYGSYRYTSE